MPLTASTFTPNTTDAHLRISTGLYGPNIGAKVCPITTWENDNPCGENRFKAARVLSDVAAYERSIAIIDNTNITTLPPLPTSIMTLILANNANLQTLPDLSTSQIKLLDLTGCNALQFMPKVPKNCVILLPDHLREQLPEHNQTTVENLLAKLNYFELNHVDRKAIDALTCPVTRETLVELKDKPVILVKKGGLDKENQLMLSLYSYEAYKKLLGTNNGNPETREPLHDYSTIDINKDSIAFDPSCEQIKLTLFNKLADYFDQQGEPNYFSTLEPIYRLVGSPSDLAAVAKKLSAGAQGSDNNAEPISNTLNYLAARLQLHV
ncbi:MAG: hypothetical protein RSD49_17090 [Hafnia sp.]